MVDRASRSPIGSTLSVSDCTHVVVSVPQRAPPVSIASRGLHSGPYSDLRKYCAASWSKAQSVVALQGLWSMVSCLQIR